jgi:hypothetical protein
VFRWFDWSFTAFLAPLRVLCGDAVLLGRHAL